MKRFWKIGRWVFVWTVVIVLLAFQPGPEVVASGWRNLGSIALSHAIQGVSVQSLFLTRSIPSVDAERLAWAYFSFQKSQSVAEDTTGAYGSGIGYLLQGRYEQSIQQFQSVLPYRRALTEIYLGHVLYQHGNQEEALTVWSDLPEIQTGLRLQAHALLGRGLVNDAVELFSWITELAPNSVQAWLDLAESYANQGDWRRMAEVYDKILVLEPNNLDAQFKQAQTRFRAEHDVVTAQKAMDAALPRLRVVKSFDDEMRLYRSYLFLSELAQAQGKFDGAIAWLEQAMALPRIADRYAMAQIAQIFQMDGDQGQARTWMERAIAEDPADYSMHYNMGQLLSAQRDLDGALQALERAIELAPNVVGPHNALAMVLLQMGNIRRAETEFHKVLVLDPTNTEALDGLLHIQPKQ